MATLITTKEQLRTYVSTAFNFSIDVILPYIKKAERDEIVPIIGEPMYSAWTSSAPDAGNSKKVYDLLMEASANFSLLHYIPVGVVNISDSGIVVSKSANTEVASYGQIQDLKRSLEELGDSALEDALKILEANNSDFPLWTSEEAFTVFRELLVPKVADFQRYFNIKNSRKTFKALRPYILEVQEASFSWLDTDTFTQIKNATDQYAEKQALNLAQRALVNYTVAKAAESGVFLFSSTGLFTKYSHVSTEKFKELDAHTINRFITSREAAGKDATDRLKTWLEDNTDVFTDYAVPTESESPIINYKSHLSL